MKHCMYGIGREVAAVRTRGLRATTAEAVVALLPSVASADSARTVRYGTAAPYADTVADESPAPVGEMWWQWIRWV